MRTVIKKCLACSALNPYEAQICKACNCVLLADIEQEEDIRTVDPMEAGFNAAVSEATEEDDLAAQILREQIEKAKKIVEKENIEREQRQQAKDAAYSMKGGAFRGFTINGGTDGGSIPYSSVDKSKGDFGGFKIADISTEKNTGKTLGGGISLRMQAIRQAQNANKGNKK